jgi:hypothetical protein
MERGSCTYYAENKDQLKKGMDKLFSLICPELEGTAGRSIRMCLPGYGHIYYEKELLERFPYIGGKHISGTRSLTGTYRFEDGDFCDFRIKIGEKPMEYWQSVFTQGRGTNRK